LFEAEDVLNGLIRGALSGRRKSWTHTRHAIGAGSLVNAQTLLAAAGVAWGLYETWQRQQATTASAPSAPVGWPAPGGAAAAPAAANVPPPLPGEGVAGSAPGEGSLPPTVLQLMRLMVSAARADGEIGPAERERILAEAREVGAEAEVERELATPRPVAEVVAGVSDPQLKEQLYALAFTIVRADEAVTGGERIYLARLASSLALDPAAVARLEGEVAGRIQAAAARAQQ
jgi:uncharacterized membrane protein YebE (DUF533 family)